MAEDTAHLIDVEPVLVLGCSGIELIGLGIAGFAGSLFLWLLVLAPFGYWYLSVPLSLLTAVAVIVVGGKRLGKAKEGRPDGYFSNLIKSKMGRVGFGTCISHTGYWGIRR